MKKIAVVMSYFNRPDHIRRTLETIFRTKHTNYDIIVIDDASHIPMDFTPYLGPNFHVLTITKEEKDWYVPVVTYNKGFQYAIDIGAESVIIQNSECFHVGDVLMYVEENLTDSNYISFGCFSVDKDLSQKSEEEIISVMNSNRIRAVRNCETAWYNHPTINPRLLEFCNAIKTKNLIRLNGYDERFVKAVSHADTELVHRIRHIGFDTIITQPPNPVVIHTWHDHSYLPPNVKDYVNIGMALEKETESKWSHIKAIHIRTKDLS